MPNTRKKVIKTVYKDEESEGETGDFSDSGSDALISEPSTSEDENVDENMSSADEFVKKSVKKRAKQPVKMKPKLFAKEFINKINKQNSVDTEDNDTPLSLFTVKDLTDADKLLPSVLCLSESDSSDDEAPKLKNITASVPYSVQKQDESESEDKKEYNDVWAINTHDNSADIAKKTFMELEHHKTTIEKTKASLQSYVPRSSVEQTIESNVTDLLALGEETIPQKSPVKKNKRTKKNRDDSESEVEDWEEVKESKAIPQQGLQLVVELPDSVCRKSKKIDVEMMMKRKINRVKKEHQVFMHKVHVLCWIGHGNYISQVLNDQEIMTAVLAMVPQGCYPDKRLHMKYVEQITTWFKDKLTLKQDKYENKFKPKAPPLKNNLLDQIKKRTISARKYAVFIFVAMMRALGLQCRIMFNFITVPLKPPSSELCSLSTKLPKNDKGDKKEETSIVTKPMSKKANSKTKPKNTGKLPQVDGIDDSFFSSDSDIDNILQLDGNDDKPITKTRSLRSSRVKQVEATNAVQDESVSPPKRAKQGKDTTKPTLKNNSATRPEPGKIRPQRKNISKSKDGNSETESSAAKITITGNKTEPSKSAQRNNLNKVQKNNLDFSNKTSENKSNSKPDVINSINKKRDCSRSRQKVNANNGSDGDHSENESNTNENKLTAKSLNINGPTKSEPSKPPKRRNVKSNTDISDAVSTTNKTDEEATLKSPKSLSLKKTVNDDIHNKLESVQIEILPEKLASPRKTRINSKTASQAASETSKQIKNTSKSQNKKLNPPKIMITDLNQDTVESVYFENLDCAKLEPKGRNARKRSHTEKSNEKQDDKKLKLPTKTRTKSAPGKSVEKSKYFDDSGNEPKKLKLSLQQVKKQEKLEDAQRVSHRDLSKPKAKPKNDVTDVLVNIIKGRIKDAKEEAKKRIVKGKVKQESDEDSDYLPVEDAKPHGSESDEDFKPTKISPKAPKLSPGMKPSTSKKGLDRRTLSSDDEVLRSRRLDVWCEIFVEELEQWIAVDVVKGKVHCTGDLYGNATHPVCYVIGWDNNNNLKDLTRRYVPQWNTVTRKLRAETEWWKTAVQPWLGPRNARDREEDEALDRMQLEAPLPKSIAEYKNHPLYALKRHLLKYEALYPPDAATLGFVRNEPVYARECVYVCRSRDTWLKEAKVVKLGEKPYKIVKARPKWDRLSNKLITDKPLEVFGPWQVQDYEPPTAENGMVPRNAYGNVELFKTCMLPKGTVHIKLPGLNKVARKLNIDCAPAMTGFDFNGGWSHPVYDGFVVCKEFEEVVTQAWVEDQEEQERREVEKMELRVYGNWKRLIKGLLIRERLKLKYGFEEPSASQPDKNKKGPRLVCKKKS